MNCNKEYAQFMEDIFDSDEFIACDKLSEFVEKIILTFRESSQIIIRMKYGINDERIKYTYKKIEEVLNEKYSSSYGSFNYSKIKDRINECVRSVRRANVLYEQAVLVKNALNFIVIKNNE